MNYAITDIGANTVKFTVYKVENGKYYPILSQSEPVGLASKREGNRLTDEGIASLCRVINGYKSIAQTVGTEKFFCLATASMRGLDNLSAVTAAVKKETGADIETVSGEREAELSFKGFRAVVEQFGNETVKSGIYIDMGGSSTEIVSVDCGGMGARVSLPFGVLKLYNMFVDGIVPTEKEAVHISEYVDQILNKEPMIRGFDGSVMYAAGGTVKAIGKVISKLTGLKYGNMAMYTPNCFENAYSDILSMKRSVIHDAVGAAGDRMHFIIPGLCVMNEIIEFFDMRMVYTVYSGIRDGYINELIEKGN